jgi:hypothetical protein
VVPVPLRAGRQLTAVAMPKIQIEVTLGNGLGPHGNGSIPSYPIGRGHTDTMYTRKPIGTGTISMPELGDRNNALDSSFLVRKNSYHVDFQKYFTVKNLKVLLEKKVTIRKLFCG